MLTKELDQIEIDRFNLKDRVKELELLRKGLQEKLVDPTVISKYFNQFKERFNKFNFETKRNIINILINDINIRIHHKEKTGTIKIKPRNMKGLKFDEKFLLSSSFNKQLLRTSMPNSNFLIFSESFYITRFKNKGYRYHLGKETKQPPSINTSESKADRKKRYTKLMKKNNWTRAELARHLGVSRAWVSKMLNK